MNTSRGMRAGLPTVIGVAALLGTTPVPRVEPTTTLTARMGRLQANVPVDGFVPARRVSGSLPANPPPNVVGWIEGTMEIEIDATGRTERTAVLRATPRLSDLVAPYVSDWRFLPATDRGEPIPSGVLIAAVFRPAVLYNDPAPGDPPVSVALPRTVPLPIATPSPLYPPLGATDAVVLVEVFIGRDGRVHRAQAIGRTPTFDEAALDAARQWSFRPARRDGRAVDAYAYLIFGFRRPIATSGPPAG